MAGSARTSITLRALEGEPLRDEAIAGMVTSTAHAIAERQGVEVLNVEADADSITVTLGVSRIAAWGFAAELRRLTANWFAHKYGGTLWGEPPHTDEEDEEDGREAWEDHDSP